MPIAVFLPKHGSAIYPRLNLRVGGRPRTSCYNRGKKFGNKVYNSNLSHGLVVAFVDTIEQVVGSSHVLAGFFSRCLLVHNQLSSLTS